MNTITITITLDSAQQQSIDALSHMATALGALSVGVAPPSAVAAPPSAVAAPPSAVAAPPRPTSVAAPAVIHATKAEALAAQAAPPAATAGVLGPADMRVTYVGPTVRSPAVGALQAEFRGDTVRLRIGKPTFNSGSRARRARNASRK